MTQLPPHLDSEIRNAWSSVQRIGSVPEPGVPTTEKLRACLANRYPELVSLLGRMGFPPDDAHDAATEAMVCGLLRLKAGTVGELTDRRAWLESAAINIARRNASKRLACDLLALAVASVTPFDDLEELEEQARHIAVIHDAIGRLPDRLRFVLAYCCIEGHTYAEAMRAFGVCHGEISRRLRDARTSLRAELHAHGIAIREKPRGARLLAAELHSTSED